MEIHMKTAKLFANGQSQAVRLPKDYRFSGEEVGIMKVGEAVVLYPKDNKWERFLKTEKISDDFEKIILEGRNSEISDKTREDL